MSTPPPANAGSIVVLGSANMDLVVRQPRRAEPGETIFGTGFSTGAGGKGLNQAIAAARAGASVHFLGAVGDDAFGHRLREQLEGDGVLVHGLRTVSEATGIAQITVTDDGENSIVVVPGANATADLIAADRATVAAASHLLVQLERPLDLVEAAMRHARSAGVMTVLTPAPVHSGLERLLALTDVLVPNEGEARQLTGLADSRAAAIELSRSVGMVLVTLGARGVLLAREGRIVAEVAAPAVTPIDTTAAGDTFVGVLIAWLSAGGALAESVDAAVAAAAIAVTRVGASDSMPRRDEIVAALRRRNSQVESAASD